MAFSFFGKQTTKSLIDSNAPRYAYARAPVFVDVETVEFYFRRDAARDGSELTVDA